MIKDPSPASKKNLMSRPHGPWQILETELVYRDAFVALTLDRVIRPDAKAGKHVVVEMKPGVCVLPLDLNGFVHLTREFHYAIGRVSLEGVSGGIEAGENPLVTAQRELKEELGLHADHWKSLTTLDPYTTIIRSPVELFLATRLSPVLACPEGTEQIESVALPLEQAVQWVASGQITHGPTCVALLLLARQEETGRAANPNLR